MLSVASNMLILKNVNMNKNENGVYEIVLSYKDIDNKTITHTFEYHYYENAINDFMLLAKSIK